MATGTTPTSYFQRLFGAAALDPAVYEEVEDDRKATTQAFATVLLASIAVGVGAQGPRWPSVVSVSVLTVAALLLWASWAVLTFEVGSRLLPGRRTHTNTGELLRTTGFAAAPGFFAVFGLFPGVTRSALAVSIVWMIAAMVVAVRHALDYEHVSRAIAVCVLGFTLAAAIAVVIGVAFGPAVR